MQKSFKRSSTGSSVIFNSRPNNIATAAQGAGERPDGTAVGSLIARSRHLGVTASLAAVAPADRYNMHTGEWIEYTAMSNDLFKEKYG